MTVTLDAVTSDEGADVAGGGDGATSPDCVLVGGGAQVRAERQGGGDGRVYALHATADDGRGGTCEAVVTVCVPHDQGADAACLDSGQVHECAGP